MIEVQDRQVEEILQDAIRHIPKQKNSQIVSITKKIEAKHPVLFFEAAAHLQKDRIFWTSTKDDFAIVGVGNAFEIIANEDRFYYTESTWKQLLKNTIISNPFHAPGTGLVCLGGMDFDPEKQQTSLWSDFPAIHFTVPEYMLTKNEDDYYFTINIPVHRGDHAEQLIKELYRTEKALFNHEQLPSQQLQVLNKRVIAPNQWKKTVQKAKEEIKVKPLKKIVLAREMRLKLNQDANIANLLKDLLEAQPNSYIFAFEQNESCFVGATPERLVKVEKNHLLSTCLAGTAPRGTTKAEDDKIADKLLHDEKNREEHEFVVQMIKQGLKKYCTNIHVPEVPVVYPLRNLQHLYTPVTGTLLDGHSIFTVVKELHPTPALGGTPRDLSLKFIRDYEILDRGWYGAPIGWLDNNANGEFAVAIRSALIQQDEASLFAGCGVVRDSDPEAEYEETRIKFLPMLSVLGGQA